MRNIEFPDVPVEEASAELLQILTQSSETDTLLQLEMYRKLDKLASYNITQDIIVN